MQLQRAVPWNGVRIALAAVLVTLLSGCELITAVTGDKQEATLTVFPSSTVKIGVTGSGLQGSKDISVTAKDKAGSIENFFADVDNTAYASITNKTTTGFTVNAVAVGATSISIQSASGKNFTLQVQVMAANDTKPSVPTGLTTSASPTTNSIALKWDSTSDSTVKWDLQKSSGGGAWTSVATSLASASYTVTSLAANTSYSFQVRAQNSAGASDWSPSLTVSTAAEEQPTTITAQPSLSIGLVYSNLIQVKWSSVQNATKYEVQEVNASGGFVSTLVNDYVGYDYTHQGLSASTTHYYQVRGKNDFGNTGPWSSTISATTTAVSEGTAPASAPSLFVDGYGSDWARLKWSQVTGASGYLVSYSSIVGGTASSWISTSVVGQLETTLYGLSSGTTYQFKIQAFNNYGYGPETASPPQVTTLSTNTNTAPLPPTGLSATASLNGNGYAAQLSWSSSPGATGYDVYRQDPNSSSYNYIGSTGQYNTAYLDSMATTQGAYYYYYVVAYNGYGISSPSSVVSYYSPYISTGIEAPTVWSYGSSGTNYVEIDWSYVTNANYYNVYVSTDGGMNYSYNTFSYYNYTYYYGPDGMGMANDTTYYFYVTAVDGNGNESPQSNVLTYTTPPATSSTTPVTIHIN